MFTTARQTDFFHAHTEHVQQRWLLRAGHCFVTCHLTVQTWLSQATSPLNTKGHRSPLITSRGQAGCATSDPQLNRHKHHQNVDQHTTRLSTNEAYCTGRHLNSMLLRGMYANSKAPCDCVYTWPAVLSSHWSSGSLAAVQPLLEHISMQLVVKPYQAVNSSP